jgi:APA family basic amino acid/polyamine antiporter
MKLKKQVGLLGGTALVVGGVIGMGAFVLIPLICSKAGGAAWLSVSVAVVLSLLSVFPIIQLAAAMPTAGGGFVYGHKLISPLTGFLFSWLAVVGGAAAMALVAYGLVESFTSFLPNGFSLHVASILLVIAFYGVYQLGLRILSALQVLMVVQMLLALLLYAIPVLLNSYEKVIFGMPQSSSFLMAIILSFNISMGFQIIMELGEEMERPERNIPISLVIGAGVILMIYLLVIAAYSGIVGIDNISSKHDMIQTAVPLLPEWAIWFIRLGLINAGLTCFNGTAIAIPREIFAQARAGYLPSKLANVNSNNTPANAVALYFLLVVSVLTIGEVLDRAGLLNYFFGNDIIEFYGFITIGGIMTLTVGVSIAALYLPAKAPEAYQNAYIKFSPLALKVFVGIAVITSLFLIMLVSTKWIVPLFFICVIAAATLLYVIRKNSKIKN